MRKKLEKEIEPGNRLEIGDVILTNREGFVMCYFVNPEVLIPLSRFINLANADAIIRPDTKDYEIDNHAGKWKSVDYIILDGKQYFWMENQKFGKQAAAVVLDQYGKVILDQCKNGFSEQVKEELRAINNGRKTDQVPHNNLKQRMELWQKYFDNGNYLRSAEMTEEQNYNMIDGRMNNLLQKKEKGKRKRSVLRRLYNKKCEVAKKLGRPLPRRYEILEKEKKF